MSFAAQARAFYKFVSNAHELPIGDRLLVARRELLALYLAALELPEGLRGDEVERIEAPTPAGWQSFGVHEHYWEVFDPYQLTEPVVGSLSDDILDVFLDVARGLALSECGEEAAACREWRFSFASHWGDHAIDALRALHRATSTS